MADEPETDKTDPIEQPPAGETGGSDPTLHQLSERVDRLTTMFEQFMEGSHGQAQEEAPDIKAEVRAAVRVIEKEKGEKAAKAEAQKSIEDRIAELEHVAQKPPQEYKRATERMGWARP